MPGLEPKHLVPEFGAFPTFTCLKNFHAHYMYFCLTGYSVLYIIFSYGDKTFRLPFLSSKLNDSNFPGIVESMTQHLLSSAFSAKSGFVMGEETLLAGTQWFSCTGSIQNKSHSSKYLNTVSLKCLLKYWNINKCQNNLNLLVVDVSLAILLESALTQTIIF